LILTELEAPQSFCWQYVLVLGTSNFNVTDPGEPAVPPLPALPPVPPVPLDPLEPLLPADPLMPESPDPSYCMRLPTSRTKAQRAKSWS
jgi:hypothetical protein